jgi:FkbM family methyltransferase
VKRRTADYQIINQALEQEIASHIKAVEALRLSEDNFRRAINESSLGVRIVPGVGFDSVFEKDCADRGMKVFLADGSVEKPTQSHELFEFTQKHISIKTNDKFMTIDDWVKSSWPDSQGDLLLQMDIEGSEYEVLLIASDDLLKRFRIIVVEFHALNELWSKPFFKLVSQVFEKLLQTHTCVHNHPNNCSDSVKFEDIELPMVTELTFLRNDRVSSPSFTKIFPHPLDTDNTQNKPSLPLPKCWYNGK